MILNFIYLAGQLNQHVVLVELTGKIANTDPILAKEIFCDYVEKHSTDVKNEILIISKELKKLGKFPDFNIESP